MIRINQIKFPHDDKFHSYEELKGILSKKCSKILRIDPGNIAELEIIRHSIDARKKPEIFHIYMVDIKLKGLDEKKVVSKCRDKNVSVTDNCGYNFNEMVKMRKNLIEDDKVFGKSNQDKDIVIVGAGPAGLFCGYMLALNGFKPVILERGADVDKRTEIVEHFWKTGELNTSTNVQFGEGGAGTFSDGKLNTMVKDKDGRGRQALKIFVENGANEDIIYEAKPHIGTDILRNVVKNMREKIITCGGEVKFNCQVTDILLDEDSTVKGVEYIDDSKHTINCSTVVLAIGHSARDTFYMLKDRKIDMAPKPFAVGFRVEHPQSLINLSQYGMENPKGLPPAPYKLTSTTDSGRGVYSFCMCPGGYVVNASSEEGMLAVNGMSYSKRDGNNANSAIIITVDPKDFGSDDILSGVEFQRKLEKKAFELGKGKIPVEYYGDFKKAVAKAGTGNEAHDNENNEEKINTPCMCGEYVFADVHTILTDDLNSAFVEGMEKFGRTIHGYNNDGALVSGVESRTSSPVRINRGDNCQSVNVKGLYPCGEGAGYAGGIMSAAMDGIKIAEYIAAYTY
ncbi:NAD(P)/FAD-dependent oxidoreductase [Butyrivibrio sp. VCB2006]|uniref:NAD(P)/FAD-dependent oxidoreductase n=1 Tax=Butyrivibrio sp. VCB2006 TaxID=1280679 RepID=UPI000409C4AB|nr:FAD-dependent oxidoreductase [Butyrivibrio sp. VCB2006]